MQRSMKSSGKVADTVFPQIVEAGAKRNARNPAKHTSSRTGCITTERELSLKWSSRTFSMPGNYKIHGKRKYICNWNWYYNLTNMNQKHLARSCRTARKTLGRNCETNNY